MRRMGSFLDALHPAVYQLLLLQVLVFRMSYKKTTCPTKWTGRFLFRLEDKYQIFK
jgi:hypothetical protein